MTFSPVLPMGGTAGWAFLKRTEAAQLAAFVRRPDLGRDEAYFRDRIGKVADAQALVADRRLLRITLEAFGLEADLDAKAFIARVLSDGTLKAGALATKLTDPRYREMSAAFGFDLAVPRSRLSDFPDRIMARWKERRFEAAVGAQHNGLRLAMTARRELAALARGSGGEDAKWFRVMGNAPLRAVVQGAFGLPDSFAALDIDRQLAMLKGKAQAALGQGTVTQFSEPAQVERLIRLYMIRQEEAGIAGGQGPAQVLLGQAQAMFRRI